MQNPYTEAQYKEYHDLTIETLEANYTEEQDKRDEAYNKMQKWLSCNNINDDIEIQMLIRVAQEYYIELNREEQECKTI